MLGSPILLNDNASVVQRVQWVFRPHDPQADRSKLVQSVEAASLAVPASIAPRLKLTAAVEPPPKWAVIPFSARPVVVVSVDTPDRGRLQAAVVEAGVHALSGITFESYAVTTSEPVAPPGEAKAGATTPGVELLTLFRRKPGLADAAFIERWHGVHTPLSLEIHPLRGYIRNVVEARWPNDATPLDAIVEEHFAQRRDLLNPSVFFGGLLAMLPNMVRVAADIRRFIDLSTIETYWVTERWIRAD